jgi:hypothetical protein
VIAKHFFLLRQGSQGLYRDKYDAILVKNQKPLFHINFKNHE